LTIERLNFIKSLFMRMWLLNSLIY
jgi:hypothetical protein